MYFATAKAANSQFPLEEPPKELVIQRKQLKHCRIIVFRYKVPGTRYESEDFSVSSN